MSSDQQPTSARKDPFIRLERMKADCLMELLKRRPGQKGYRKALRAYLEADADLQRAIMKQLRLRF
jgi:hypothetical protein